MAEKNKIKNLDPRYFYLFGSDHSFVIIVSHIWSNIQFANIFTSKYAVLQLGSLQTVWKNLYERLSIVK